MGRDLETSGGPQCGIQRPGAHDGINASVPRLALQVFRVWGFRFRSQGSGFRAQPCAVLLLQGYLKV